VSQRTRVTAALAGRQHASHEAIIGTKEKYLNVLIGNVLIQFHDARGIKALAYAVDTAKAQARAVNLPIIAPTAVDQDMSTMSRVAIGAHPRTTVSAMVPPAARQPHLRIEIGQLVLLTYDQTSIDSLIGITKRAERMSTELPGAFSKTREETYRRLENFARKRGIELGDDDIVHDAVFALSRREDVPWLYHARADFANSLRVLAVEWAKHAEFHPDRAELLAEPILTKDLGLS